MYHCVIILLSDVAVSVPVESRVYIDSFEDVSDALRPTGKSGVLNILMLMIMCERCFLQSQYLSSNMCIYCFT